MKIFKILYYDGYDDVRDADAGAIIFSTILPDDLIPIVGRKTMDVEIIESVVNIWNETGDININLYSGGLLDQYLLDANCSTDEMEIITESLFRYHQLIN